ncbi:hypothetical protein CEXT_346191 [Caerostris extrusa]|uniref:Uncharacterized protein n=1 Tax=Caerostris extrusa TaxID=172846 RepID=A0AAV4WCA0_CAEEX|nr:hypothetical protein CEXT_346191 [Caerostris extrusa]
MGNLVFSFTPGISWKFVAHILRWNLSNRIQRIGEINNLDCKLYKKRWFPMSSGYSSQRILEINNLRYQCASGNKSLHYFAGTPDNELWIRNED